MEYSNWKGSAKAASTQTFVVVEISGNPKEYVNRKVVLTVTAAGRQIFKQSQDFSITDESKNYSAAFLLYDTGCEVLKLKAEITNEKSQIKRSV